MKYKGIQITESTYEITCSLSLDVFKQEIRKVIRSNDKVYVISVNTDNVLFTLKFKVLKLPRFSGLLFVGVVINI